MTEELQDLEAIRDHLAAAIAKAEWYTDSRKDIRTALVMAHRACEAAYDRLDAMEAAWRLEEMNRLSEPAVRWEEPHA
jgi:hypothetical protein